MYVQDDARWASLRIGNTTVGEEGCLIVCICNANKVFGNTLNPSVLVRQLYLVDGFKPNGDLIWSKLKETSSIVWQCLDGSNELPSVKIIEYESEGGKSHFVLEHRNVEIDPKPGTLVKGARSTRYLAFIEKD